MMPGCLYEVGRRESGGAGWQRAGGPRRREFGKQGRREAIKRQEGRDARDGAQ